MQDSKWILGGVGAYVIVILAIGILAGRRVKDPGRIRPAAAFAIIQIVIVIIGAAVVLVPPSVAIRPQDGNGNATG